MVAGALAKAAVAFIACASLLGTRTMCCYDETWDSKDTIFITVLSTSDASQSPGGCTSSVALGLLLLLPSIVPTQTNDGFQSSQNVGEEISGGIVRRLKASGGSRD